MSFQVVTIPQSIRGAPRKICRRIWNGLPEAVLRTQIVRQVGRFIYRQFSRDTVRLQSHYTCFMRNPPLLKALSALVSNRSPGSTLKVASVGCSTGAELYSVLYVLRRDHSHLKVSGTGIDVSSAVVQAARNAVYRPNESAAANALFNEGRPELMAADVESLSGLLEPGQDGELFVRYWVREGTTWLTGDATKASLLDLLPPQDIVLANNVIGPMEDQIAEACLLNIMKLVLPGGYLIIDGIDLDLKMRVLMNSPFVPAMIAQEDIWNADASKAGWPWLRWGREPWDPSHPNGSWRYSCVFQRLR